VSFYQHFKLVDLVLVFLIAHGHQSFSNVNLSFYERDEFAAPFGSLRECRREIEVSIMDEEKNLLLILVQSANNEP
jgi:hypothetical protein